VLIAYWFVHFAFALLRTLLHRQQVSPLDVAPQSFTPALFCHAKVGLACSTGIV
jgi:hypothetical protein